MSEPLYIAIVDDDDSVRRSFSRLLTHAGFCPLTFASAEEYLACQMRSSYGCLLLDIQLTGLSGTDLHRQLIASGDHIPVVYITACDDPRTKAEALARGCAGYFRKTDPGHDIIDAIRRVTSHPH
jgi:FixJ family two-component response regulator